MDRVKICLNTQKHEITMLNIVEMIDSGGTLTITLSGNSGVLSVSDIVTFSRNILNEDENYQVIDSYSTRVLSVEEGDSGMTYFTITAPENYMIQVNNITSGDGYYKIDCTNNHNIFSQDIITYISGGGNECLYYEDKVKGDSGDVCTVENICLHEYSSYFPNDIVEPKYCLFNIKLVDSYNCEDDPTVFELSPNFYYKRSDIDTNSFFVTNDVLIDDINKLYKGVYLPYNLFYYKDRENICHIWNYFKEDEYYEVASGITEIQGYDTDYKSSKIEESSVVNFYEDNSEYKISLGLSQNVDYKHLYQEENITNLFTEKIKEAVVDESPIIDMEKVKFSPYIDNAGNESVSALCFNLHFRTRTDLQESWRYVKNNENRYWNPDYCIIDGEYDTHPIAGYSDISRHISTGNVLSNSDMLYYLGFTDNDVQNQKAKIKKSFLRLSFYDSTNPLTQKLLYYSTIFIDSGELFGKYVKAKSELRKNGKDIDNVVLDSYQTNNRLDCKFIVRDEFYTEKSSEGFNIYYFPSDVILSENSEKTIYMKIEFNHAGFGRTIPLIACGNVGTGGMSLDTYMKRLYIDVSLKYIDGKFIYTIPNTNHDGCIQQKGSTIEFNLFEPVIDKK